MKKIYFLFALVIPLMGIAQTNKNKPKLTGEQHAILQSKKLQLALDLNKKQVKQIEQELKNQSKQFSKTKQKRERLNGQERYMQHLDVWNNKLLYSPK